MSRGLSQQDRYAGSTGLGLPIHHPIQLRRISGRVGDIGFFAVATNCTSGCGLLLITRCILKTRIADSEDRNDLLWPSRGFTEEEAVTEERNPPHFRYAIGGGRFGEGECPFLLAPPVWS